MKIQDYTPGSEHQAATGPVIALDAHVHFYPGIDLDGALDAGHDHLSTAAQVAGYRPDMLCLLLTETARDNAFGALASGALTASGWCMERIRGDEAVLRAKRRTDGAELVLIAGRQIISQEKIEVLALATAAQFSDGQPVRAVLGELHGRGIPAILPWGVGKWVGKRGTLTTALLDGAPATGLMLGDNAGRPVGWRTPPLFHKAVAQAVPVLPGSDPLPVPGAEKGIGRFGSLIEGRLDPDQPARALGALLFALRGQPLPIGHRRGPLAVVNEQIALRRRKSGVARQQG